jgi:predicted PurR-regulated permease PerM
MIRKYPFYIKVTLIMLGMVLLSYILLNLRDILVPLAFGLLLAVLLNPLTIFLEKHRFPLVAAIAISILVAMLVIAGLTYFLFMEAKNLTGEWPLIKEKFGILFNRLQHFAKSDFGISTKKQNDYISEAGAGLKPVLATAMGTVLGGLEMTFLLPVYAFLFLYYKKLILNFLFELFAESGKKEVGVVLSQTRGAIQNYMVGLLLEALIVATLNTAALMILGVPYAILLGVLGALLNILPFIGGILAVLLPILVATLTKDGFSTQFWIIISYMSIQFVDNHFLVPYIVASKVKINALISIVIVIAGGALWGIAGMFLSIPALGVLKIIFDRIPEMKAWGMLIGTEVPTKRKRLSLTSKPNQRAIVSNHLKQKDTAS